MGTRGYRCKVFETEELQVRYSGIKAYGWDSCRLVRSEDLLARNQYELSDSRVKVVRHTRWNFGCGNRFFVQTRGFFGEHMLMNFGGEGLSGVIRGAAQTAWVKATCVRDQ